MMRSLNCQLQQKVKSFCQNDVIVDIFRIPSLSLLVVSALVSGAPPLLPEERQSYGHLLS